MLVSGKILDSCTFDACGLMGWSPRVMPLSLPPLARNHHAMAVADQIKFRTRIFPRGSHLRLWSHQGMHAYDHDLLDDRYSSMFPSRMKLNKPGPCSLRARLSWISSGNNKYPQLFWNSKRMLLLIWAFYSGPVTPFPAVQNFQGPSNSNNSLSRWDPVIGLLPTKASIGDSWWSFCFLVNHVTPPSIELESLSN